MINILDLGKKYGLMIPKSIIANSDEDAVLAAQKIGFPIVLKIESPDILHKTDLGGVKLNLKTGYEVKEAYNEIIESVKDKKPDALIRDILVQEMLSKGFELIIGYTNDLVFGPSIMLGMGGIFTEIFEDVVFRLLPITEDDANQMVNDLKFSKILFEGFRNIPKVSKNMLVEVICRVADMAIDLEKYVDSFDMNPIVVWGSEYKVVDFKFVKSKKENVLKKQIPNIRGISNFFSASSVALIGASGSPDKIGNLVLNNLSKHGYQGKIYPINPKYKSIAGIKSYSSILEVPREIDLVIITISLRKIPVILEQCKRRNISNVIIISAGGKEIGESEIEEKIRKLASDYKIRIIGCNCLGIFDGYSRIDTLFQPYERMNRPIGGSISLISQSGTVGIAFLELLGKYGVSRFISYGNRIDVDEGDLIMFLGDDSSTNVIAIYIEGLEKGRKFFDAIKRVIGKKPIVVYKAGRTSQASEAAVSHTGFLTGKHNLIEGAMKQANVVQVDSLENLIASSKILSIYSRVRGNRVIMITNGAGIIIQSIDKIISQNKLKLAKLSDDSINKLKEILPGHVIVENPIDLTGTATDEQYEVAIKSAVEDKNIDIIMICFVFQCKPITQNIVSILKKYSNKKPVVCCSIGAEYTHKMGEIFEKEKIPIFYSVEEWVSATGAICYNNNFFLKY